MAEFTHRQTPPAVHSMVVKLHELGLITREPGQARTIRVAIPKEEIPWKMSRECRGDGGWHQTANFWIRLLEASTIYRFPLLSNAKA